ncbi:MAG: zinc dependent phospholipase C family protein [Bacilli bacterium]|jgi:hypothetical protein|nr:zinc dependent phospholipase C family protein [Bacilli bacterium]
MPNLLAHNLVVKRFYLKEDEQDLSPLDSFIRGNYDFLSLGAQGPDPFFYVGILPFHGLHLLTASKKLGNQLHEGDAKKFFKAMIDRCYGMENDRDRLRFEAFIFGQLAHYLLDREAHPYILYESGFDKDGKISGKYHYQHANFESNIDYCLAKKFKMNYFLSNPADVLCQDKSFLAILDSEMVPVLEGLFRCRLPKHFYSNSIINMHSVIGYVNHHPKAKKKLLPKRLMGLAMPTEGPLDYPDCLNEKKDIWLDPLTGAKHADSFLEIHSRAFELLDSCYQDILKNGFHYEVISKYLNGLSYYGTPVGAKWTYQKNPVAA